VRRLLVDFLKMPSKQFQVIGGNKIALVSSGRARWWGRLFWAVVARQRRSMGLLNTTDTLKTWFCLSTFQIGGSLQESI